MKQHVYNRTTDALSTYKYLIILYSWGNENNNHTSGKCGSTHHVCSEIDAENCYGTEGQRNVAQDESEEGRDLGNVGCEGVGDGFLKIIEDEPSFFHSGYDRGEVVVEQDHVGGLLGHVGAGDAHGHADVGLLQGGGVVDAVT